jgi:Na+/H+ antiporter NhaC
MLRAERRAASGGGLYRKGAQLAADMSTELREADSIPPGRWWNGAIPVAILVAVVLVGLVTTGLEALDPADARTLRNIFGGADPYSPLIWGSMMACIAAAFLAIGQRLVRLSEVIGAWLAGLRAMLLAIVILVMAWSLGSVTQTLETAPFLAQSLSDTLAPQLLPTFVFIIAAIIAFSTGTSWATMAILLPLVVPLAIAMVGTIAPASGAEQAIVMGSIGSVLAGAIMGDHCSPISDTTVLSSTASSCDHVDHVRTQLPYALLVGAVGILLGGIPTVLGVPVWVCLALCAAAIYGVLRVFGRVADEGQREPQEA